MHHNRSTAFSIKVQASNDINFLSGLLSASNGRARHLAGVRISELTKTLPKSVPAPIPVAKAVSKSQADLSADDLKAKRSAAAKKAAATRAAKKASLTA